MSFKELQIFDKVTSWPQLILNLLVAPACLLIGPTLFHTPGVFVYIYMHCKYVGKISQTLIANDSNLLVAYMHSTSVYSLIIIGLMKPLRTAILAKWKDIC